MISLCMIVRDEEANLPRVLGSVKGLVDEMVIVDTGSTDRTIDVARSWGARVDRIEWPDDFAAARNHSLSLAKGDWILVLDGDDEFEREDIPVTRGVLEKTSALGVCLEMTICVPDSPPFVKTRLLLVRKSAGPAVRLSRTRGNQDSSGPGREESRARPSPRVHGGIDAPKARTE
jgi:glycosyltransferase involved in cell wall biosynthesis